eukprot:CAMPEP_0115117246 /NCGR_PEP_ID=MMETSP0227-20121206/43764_2 /TAXON_ID=89957 /ORGANISM="Polarella glacialis, Strain CCMP 1383" /LENGTH=38 /DNA_ID= /DNA_START= /DNA_END= /DNA_ORIENTATION=
MHADLIVRPRARQSDRASATCNAAKSGQHGTPRAVPSA